MSATATSTPAARTSINQEVRIAVRHSAIYGLGTALAKLIGFLLLPLYTHYLSPSDYGVLEILDLTMSLVGMFMNMGMTAAVLRFYNKAGCERDKRQVVSTAFWFVIGSGAIFWVCAAGLARPVTTTLFSAAVPSRYFLISFTSFTLGYIMNVPATYIQAREASGTIVLADTLTTGLMLGLNIYFIAFLKIGLIGILISPLCAGVIRIGFFGVWIGRSVGAAFSWPKLWEMLRFGAPLVFSNLAMFTLNFSDRFFLKHYSSLDTVGVYSIAYKFGFILNIAIIQPFYFMWQARMYIIDQRPDRIELFRRIFIYYSLLITFAALCLSVMSPEIVHFMLDRRFASSRSVIPVIALAYLVYGVGCFFQGGLLMNSLTRNIGLLSVAAAAMNLGLNFWLVRQFGMMGAAWATVLGFCVLAVGYCYFSWQRFSRTLHVYRFVKAAAIAAALYWVSTRIAFESVAAALSVKAAVLAAFPVMLVVSRCLSREELEAVLHARKRLLRKGAEVFGWKRVEA